MTSAYRHFKRMRIHTQDEMTVLEMGEAEIWDGADLALLREGLMKLIEEEGCRGIAINMQFVKYIPSGFFGMLFDWYEKRGVTFWLLTPQPNVQRMLWFRRFFRLASENAYELHSEPNDLELPGVPPQWHTATPNVVHYEIPSFATLDEE